jgi:hypothetical protein
MRSFISDAHNQLEGVYSKILTAVFLNTNFYLRNGIVTEIIGSH